MMNNMKILASALFTLLLVPAAFAQELPEGNGKKLVDEVCSVCHGTDLIIQFRDDKTDKATWQSEVDKMVGRGADLQGDDLKTVVNYLAKYLGPAVNVNQAMAKDLATELDLSDQTAQAVVQYRKDKGNFKEFADLGKVSGLDLKKLEPFKTRISF
jgi:competence ComEA-like helix-hairpin-helix protein